MKIGLMMNIKGVFHCVDSYDAPCVPRVGEKMAIDTENTSYGLDCIVYEVIDVCHGRDKTDIYLNELCRMVDYGQRVETTLSK